MNKVLGGMAGMSHRRLALLAAAIFFSSVLLLGAFSHHEYVAQSFDAIKGSVPYVGSGSASGSTRWPSPPATLGLPVDQLPQCGDERIFATRKTWLESTQRYAALPDDKFTIAILTYQRPHELNQTLHALTETKIPSLHEIVVIWNEIDAPLPAGWVSPHGIPVRYRLSQRNSMTMKFVVDPAYATRAVMLHDDDVWYKPADLEFVFQTWRRLGRYRMTGALPRCYAEDKQGRISYAKCPTGGDWYAMVLTNLAFVDISFLDYFSSDEPIPTAVRARIDDVFNCDDLAMNFLMSMLTCTGPLHVLGKEPYFGLNPKVGISTKGNHGKLRNGCLNYFKEVIGFNPLVKQYGSIQRGVPHYG